MQNELKKRSHYLGPEIENIDASRVEFDSAAVERAFGNGFLRVLFQGDGQAAMQFNVTNSAHLPGLALHVASCFEGAVASKRAATDSLHLLPPIARGFLVSTAALSVRIA